MKTKEEILNDCHWNFVKEKGISSIHTKEFPSAYSEQAQIAMDEYAKQQAIAFDDWTAFNHVKYQKGGTWICAGKVYEQPPTNEQLYTQFVESLNK